MGKYSEAPQNPNTKVEEEEEEVVIEEIAGEEEEEVVIEEIAGEEEEEEEEVVVEKVNVWSKKKRSQVFLEGYVDAPPSTAFTEDEEDQGSNRGVSRTVSLTDDDLDELKGCLDLGFGFNYEEIPELCNTLPALELCYSMDQRFLDDQQQQQQSSDTSSVVSSATSFGSTPPPPLPIANWKISSPGDHPEDVKARLKFWAQAVACTVKLCS